jgi:hypothetical protein
MILQYHCSKTKSMFIVITKINHFYKFNKLKFTLWLHYVYTTSRLQGFRGNEIIHVLVNEGWKEWKGENEWNKFQNKGGMNKEVPTHCPHFCSNIPFVHTLLQVHEYKVNRDKWSCERLMWIATTLTG